MTVGEIETQVLCKICGKVSENEHGFNVHFGKKHPNVENSKKHNFLVKIY